MRLANIIFAVVLLASDLLSGQADTLNKVDAKGRKQGFWWQYFDKHLDPVDSSLAVYKGLEFYDSGKLIVKIHENAKWASLARVETVFLTSSRARQPALLNGKFRWFWKNDTTPIIEKEFVDGFPVTEKCFHILKRDNREYVTMTEVVDYLRRYNNMPGSYYLEDVHYDIRNKSTKVKRRMWYYKTNGKWRYHRVKA
jgi:hypothetical protein